MFQDFNLLDTLTISENIALALTINKVPAGEIDGQVREMAGKLNITDILDKYPYQVSGGQKQRCACARAIINQPKLILADEPTGALDSHSSQMLLSTIQSINEDLGATILMVTHDAFSASYAKRILFLRDGAIFIAAMVAGVILLGQMLQTQTNEAFLYLGGACLLILVGVYELHRQIPLLLHRFAKQNLRHKYKEENLFFLGQIGRRIHSAGRTMAVVAILLTISLATMFVGLTMGAGYKANMKAYYPYDAGVAIDAPLEKSNMDSIVSFTEEHCGVEDSVSYYLYAVPEKPIEALSLSDYNHLREILGLSPVVMGNNEFLVHCDTWNYMDGIRQGLKQQPEITLNGRTLTIAETPILTEPMEQYQMAGTKGYVLVLPDEAASQLVGEKIRLAMKLEDGGYPELKSDLKQFLNSGKWQPELQSGQQLPEKVTMDVTVKAWGVANSLTGFTAISFCGLYLSIIFIILSCSVLAFEQLSAIDKNQKNYAVIDRLGVPSHRQASLIRRELSTVFLIPLLFPLLLTVLLIAGAQFFFGEAILQQGLVPLYGLVTILLFCAIYLTYFGATMFLFKRVILRPEMR